jgi:hypothetical protein
MRVTPIIIRARVLFHGLLAETLPVEGSLGYFITAAALLLTPLFVGFLIALAYSTAGEIAGALASLIGGIFGAGAAVGAVFILIWRETRDEAKKVEVAVRVEITTLVKYVIGALETCKNIKTGTVQIPRQDALYIVKNFANDPVIYPAVADRIGLLPHPQATTEFYMRIAETRAMVEMLQKKATPQGITYTSPVTEYITPDFAASIADSLITALQLARPIIADEPEAPELAIWVGKVTASLIDDSLKSAKDLFPNAESFQNPGAL